MDSSHEALLPVPNSTGLRDLARSLGDDHPVGQLRRLTGGLVCDTYAFVLAGRTLVMKRFPEGAPEQLAVREFENLGTVEEALVPTPLPVLLDRCGEWFGSPTLVMTALAGHPTLHPFDMGAWTRGAATALVAVHAVPPHLVAHPTVPRWRRWDPDTSGMHASASLADEALHELRRCAERAPTVFSHDDFNPGNVLFDEGALSGVVDWSDVTIEPRQAAVALYRHQLAIHPGGRAPHEFLTSYESASRTHLSDISFWDVLYGLRAVRPVPHWARAYQGLGVALTEQAIRSRSAEWVRGALVRCQS